ncbi:MAG: WYL domain-containing protein [Candidatus Thermofonsia bacterium]|nr:MAG: WYL domain-containing protein [Candidatus Thermofonsia bacterium]
MQGPVKKGALFAAVYAAEGADAYGGQSGKQLDKRFEEDKKRLRDRLGIVVRYDKGAGGYVIADRERPLLNLPDTAIQTLAYLAGTFQPDSPHAPEVHQLIDQLVSWLPPDRQKLYRQQMGLLPTPELRLRDKEEIPQDVWDRVQEAVTARQEIQFDYYSSSHDDQIPRQHHVQPWELRFTERGHYQLHGFCIFNDGPNGTWYPNQYFNYRLSRMRDVEILPRKLPGVRPAGRPYTAIFELSPAIARFGVSQRSELIGEPIVLEMDEGWVRVEGKTHDVFHLARNLLYYGRHCHVLGGPELLREMRELVEGLWDYYFQ